MSRILVLLHQQLAWNNYDQFIYEVDFQVNLWVGFLEKSYQGINKILRLSKTPKYKAIAEPIEIKCMIHNSIKVGI